jgi:hypothetical protein
LKRVVLSVFNDNKRDFVIGAGKLVIIHCHCSFDASFRSSVSLFLRLEIPWEIFFAVALLLHLPESLENAVNLVPLVRVKENDSQKGKSWNQLRLRSQTGRLHRVNSQGSQCIMRS